MSQQTYRLTASYNAAGQFAQNVLHYRFDDGGFATTIAAANALIAAFDTHVTAQLKAALSVHTQILSYKARRVVQHGGFEAVKLGLTTDVGTRTGDLSASGLAPMIRFMVQPPPPISGRMFLPGVSDDDCDNSKVTPTYFTILTGLANLLDDTLTLTGGGAPTAVPVLLTRQPIVDSIPITLAVPASFLATQRRRQRPA